MSARRNALTVFLLIVVAASSFIAGGYVATGKWNPWGNKHYYEVLNANFEAKYCPVGGICQAVESHNVLYDLGALWVQQVTNGENPTGCTPSTTCGFKYVGLSAGTTAPAAGDAVTGATNGDCGKPTDSEITANGEARAVGTVTDISGASPKSSTVVKTFTDTTTSQAVAKSCLLNQSTQGNTNNVQLAAATFTSITLQIGDTLQITWTITWTWS